MDCYGKLEDSAGGFVRRNGMVDVASRDSASDGGADYVTQAGGLVTWK